ncbi:MAG: lytic transglycosylase domain-containing protein [Myxococcales bacterium]|nr:lytic transglycosylase domain-containing protein [Myxococcales bacterium]
MSLPSLLLALLPTASAEHPLLGQVYPSAPAHLGALLEDPGEPSIDRIQAHMQANDLSAALWEAGRFTDAHRWGRDRDVAFMVQGMLHREAGRHNLASAAFTKVRTSKGPLRAWAAYLEAEQDLQRGKHLVAARECEAYRKEFPTGRHFQDCHRVMAIGYARAGAWQKARETAAEYDQANSHAPIGEQVELTLTLELLEDHPERAVGRLRQHALDFDAPLTGRVAAEALEDLEAKGIEGAGLPDDLESRKARARSLRNAKQTRAAWEVFASIVMDAEPDDTATMRWIEAEADTFGWRTRNWDFLEELYADEYAQKSDPEAAWKRYRVLSRGGRYAEAIQAAKDGLAKHGSHRSWRYQEESLGQTYMLGGDYVGARALFDTVAKRGGWTGLRGRYYAAFSGFMAGDADPDTLARLSGLIDSKSRYAHEARFWRAQLYERMEKPELAAKDREDLLIEDPDSWYAALVREHLAAGKPGIHPRDGRWVGTPWSEPPTLEGEVAPVAATDFLHAQPARVIPRERTLGFGLLSWTGLMEEEPVEPAPAYLKVDPDLPPPSYMASLLFDPAGVKRRMEKWAAQHKGAWEDLEAAFDLARGGLYDASGPLFSAVYEEWRAAYRSGGNKRHTAARRMKLEPDEWREVFNYVRDHHHVARFNHAVWESVEDPDLAKEAKRIGYPLAHDRYVWTHSREHGIDPFLVLGLMRQESTYNSIARSPVGARGAMQIMPRTGHLLADLQHDLHYDNGDLEDPTFAVGYGIRYLGLLMERFDDAYPLAIASYNGGPFNVSSWLKGTGSAMPMDAFVEHIPFRETRDYVKKVSGNYAVYLSLYAPEGTLLAPPETPRGDHPEVVDF